MATEDNKQNPNVLQQKAFEKFMNEASQLRKRSILTDFILKCEDNVFPVHRMVLAASSPYFVDYFVQQQSFQQTAMTIDFMPSEVLQIILDYFYTGNVNLQEEQSAELLKNLLAASSKLQISLLSNYFLDLLLKKLSDNISLADWKAIEELNSEITNQIDVTAILEKLPQTESDLFLQCTHDQIIRLLFCPSAVKYNQSVILQCILDWVKHDLNERKQYLNSFLEKLDFDRLQFTKLLQFKDEELLSVNMVFLTACSKQIFKELEANKQEVKTGEVEVKGDGNSSEIAMNSKLSNGFNRKFLICGEIKSNPRTQVYIYNYSTDELQRMVAHPLYSILKSTILNYKDSIFAIAESNGHRFVYNYNIATKDWRELTLKTCNLKESTAVELNGSIYVTGKGTNNQNSYQQLECYNIEANKWMQVTQPTARQLTGYDMYGNPTYEQYDGDVSSLHLVRGNGCLYAWYLKKLHKFNPQNSNWNLLGTELTKKIETQDIHLAYGNEKIFFIQKLNPKVVWIFDTKTSSINEDVIPALKECDGIMNLDNPGYLEFLVSGDGKWFIYRPQNSWISLDPKKLDQFKLPMLTLLPS